MLVHTLGSEARNARILTQRLYGQCRKTASSWRALSQALRRLRNSIEELEDLILDEALGQSSTVPILTSLQACVQVLRDLDRHLQFYRCSAARWQAAVDETVAEVNASLARTTDAFEEACRDSSSTAVKQTAPNVSTIELGTSSIPPGELTTPFLGHDEIIICLDEQLSSDEESHAAEVQPRSPSSTSIPTPPGLPPTLQLSTEEVASNVEPRSSDDHSNHDTSREQSPRRSSSISCETCELEVDAAQIPLPMSPVDTMDSFVEDMAAVDDAIVPQDSQKLRFVSPITSSLRPSLVGWRSPFSEIDPMSVDFESATSFLLGTAPSSSDALQASSAPQANVAEPGRACVDTSSARSLSHHANQTEQCSEQKCKDEPFAHALEQAHSHGQAHSNHAEDDLVTEDYLSARSAPSILDDDAKISRKEEQDLQQYPRPSNDGTGKAILLVVGTSEVTDDLNEHLVSSVEPASGSAIETTSDDAEEEVLPPPVSKFAAEQRKGESRLSADSSMQAASRTDSKMDLHFSVPSSPNGSLVESLRQLQSRPADSASTSHHKADSETTSTTAPATVPSNGLTSVEHQADQQARLRSLSEVTLPQLNIITELRRAIPPPPLPAKGRYHIVNPSPRSRSQSLEDPVPACPTSPEIVTSGEIPMILVQDSPFPAVIRRADAKTTPITSPTIARPASAGITSPTSPVSKRYYRQSFVKTNRRTSQAGSPTAADHANFVEEAFQGTQDVDLIRIDSICHSWCRQEWTRAEAYLLAYYEICFANGDKDTVRRIRHLLGVSASFQGQWQRAISYFISSLNVPLKDASSIDEGDRAALIWLADCYILCNRRLEAFVANTLAMQGLAAHSKQSGLLTILYAEQKAILAGGSAAQLELKWNQLTMQEIAAASDTIVSHEVVSPNLIEICFNQPAGNPGQLPKPTTPLPRNRATILCELDNHNTPLAAHMEFKITHDSFRSEARWPMPYDPFFAAEQAAKGRLCDRPCDLLTMIKATPPVKIPKNGPLGSSRFACFTCGDLEWLITSVRDCLKYMEMKWDEVANAQGIWFTARFAMRHQNVLTAVYFAISLFKQSMRQGYGIEVCVDGVRSARVMHDSLEYPMGVHYSCEKRLKKFFQDYLSKAYRNWTKGGKPAGSLPATDVVSGELARDAHQFMASKAQRVVAKDLPSLPKSEMARYA